MANSDVIALIIEGTVDCIHYMLPVIAFLSGVNFVVTWLMSVTMGMGKRTFRD